MLDKAYGLDVALSLLTKVLVSGEAVAPALRNALATRSVNAYGVTRPPGVLPNDGKIIEDRRPPGQAS